MLFFQNLNLIIAVNMWFLIVLFLIILLVIYIKIKKSKAEHFWREQNVPSLKPWPIVGNMGPYALGKISFTEMVTTLYNAFPDKRYMGLHQFADPVFFIRDPDLIKKMGVKDFEVFPDRRPFGSKDTDPIWSQNIVQMRHSEGWHDLRATISPSFTSSKMKMMFELMKLCTGQITQHLQQKEAELEMKSFFSKITSDIIATVAFGVVCDSLKDPSNEFYKMGKTLTGIGGLKTLKFWGHCISPTLMKMLKIKVYDEDQTRFFRNLIKDSIRYREENNVVRPDMIHLLLETRKDKLEFEKEENSEGLAVTEEFVTTRKQKIVLSDDQIVSQAIIFFQAGFESTSTVMSFACYELALNPDVQQRLVHEISKTFGEDEITYEKLLGMKYLDMVVSECLRRWNPGAFLNRISTKEYIIEPELPGEEKVTLKAGTFLWIPIIPLHMDPKHHPNPTKFDPERFSEENKHKIKPFTYLPFGVGPRSCIASRFALLEVKLMLVEILRKFEVVPVSKTQIPLKLSVKLFMPVPDAFWLGLRRRN